MARKMISAFCRLCPGETEPHYPSDCLGWQREGGEEVAGVGYCTDPTSTLYKAQKYTGEGWKSETICTSAFSYPVYRKPYFHGCVNNDVAYDFDPAHPGRRSLQRWIRGSLTCAWLSPGAHLAKAPPPPHSAPLVFQPFNWVIWCCVIG